MNKNKAIRDDHYSSYWLDDSAGVFDDSIEKRPEDVNSIERVVKLASIRRATANFVRILTSNDKIDVKFSSGKTSYTDGRQVVIAADDNPKHFDSMVGLALHEGSHCMLSDFDFLRTVNEHDTIFYGALHPTIRKMFPLNLTDAYSNDNTNMIRNLRKYIQFIMNIIEDRRIDSYVYRMAPGYRPYYDAMYERYFFNKDAEKNLKYNPEWRVPTVDNYVNWLLMMFSPHFTPRALPGLTKMVRMIDLPNIRKYDINAVVPSYINWQIDEPAEAYAAVSFDTYNYGQFSPLWKVANELFIEIIKQAKKFADDNNQEFTLDGSQLEFEGEEKELPNLDAAPGKYNSEKGRKAIEKMRESLMGKMKKKKLNKTQQKQIETMESADAQITETSDPIMGKIPCLVTKRFSKDILVSGWFPFTRCGTYDYGRNTGTPYMQEDPQSRDGVIAGIRMGQILAHRLQLRNDPTVTHFTRQPQGKIDRRILAQLGMDIEQVFKRTTVENFRPAMLHLSLDASGSMGGRKWKNVMTVATALAYAADKVRNLDVVITLRGNIGYSGIPTVAVVHDSRTAGFHKVRQLFPYLSTSGSTPEGLCYSSTLDLIQECASTHSVFFINFSDGEPNCSFKHNGQMFDYGGYTAYKQTKTVMHRIREVGVRVMSYFISEYGDSPLTYSSVKHAFIDMYGQDAQFVNVNNVTQVLKTLNKLLLIRE
jgi:Mg-chelatase subunit ChlD